MDLLDTIRKGLKENADPETKASQERFFKEEIELYGVKAANIRRIAKDAKKTIKAEGLTKAEVFALCEALWSSGIFEEASIACELSDSQSRSFEPSDFELFEHWVKDYVSNWAACDTLCNHTIGNLVTQYPQLAERLLVWTASDNRWERRAAAVTLIIPARKGLFLSLVFDIANALLHDKDDLVQKGYGWLLKAAAEAHENEVFAYVMQNKPTMPRTALRYAIEKMPPDRKKQAMSK